LNHLAAGAVEENSAREECIVYRRLWWIAVPAAWTIVLATTTAVTIGLADSSTGKEPGPGVNRQMLAAMQRDLNLTADQALRRLTREEAATHTDNELRASLSAGFAGSWLDPDDQQLIVGITDPGQADLVVAKGAQPQLVKRSATRLTEIMAALEAANLPDAVSNLYVDPAANQVVVEADPDGLATAAAFVTASGADPAAVRVLPSAGRDRMEADVFGGQPYNVGNRRCSVGFAVKQILTNSTIFGFLTAGHCGVVPELATFSNGTNMGRFRGSVYPGNDFAWFRAVTGVTPRAAVIGPDGGPLKIGAIIDVPVGGSVCRNGRTTGWQCGVVLAVNSTRAYQDGSILRGMTVTNACSATGDSGGPYVMSNFAVGIHSGASGGSCDSGTHRTIMQPIRPALAAFRLTLHTQPIVATCPPPFCG
jgi:streptogrisin C